MLLSWINPVLRLCFHEKDKEEWLLICPAGLSPSKAIPVQIGVTGGRAVESEGKDREDVGLTTHLRLNPWRWKSAVCPPEELVCSSPEVKATVEVRRQLQQQRRHHQSSSSPSSSVIIVPIITTTRATVTASLYWVYLLCAGHCWALYI